MEPVKRTIEIDGIRLAALVGICVVNLPFMGLPIEAAFMAPAGMADRWAMFVIEAFFQVKFFLLFAFVFGWGVAIQSRSAKNLTAEAFKKRYFKRQFGLAIFGIAHALLVFTGDILLIYAIVGLFLWPLREAPLKQLLKVSLAATGVSMVALALLAILVDELMTTGLLHTLASELTLGGSYVQTMLSRIQDWPGTLGFLILLQGPLVFMAFCLGLASVKVELFSLGSPAFNWLERQVPWLLIIALPLNVWYAITVGELWPSQPDLLQLGGFMAIAIGGPALSACYLVGIVKLVRSIPVPEILAQAGRNSLSTYILQGVIAGWVFGGYGLGLFNQLDPIILLPLSVLIALLAILLVGAYASLFGKGPLEPLLRKIVKPSTTETNA